MELYKQSEELLAKRAIAEKDFELLNTKNLLGNYLECEFTHIVIEKRDSHELFHYFGIISYEEFLEPADIMRTKKISTGNRKLTENLNIGIYQFRISLIEAQNIFKQLKNGILNFRDSNIKIPTSYILLPKTFVPSQWDNKSPLLNKVLKPTIFTNSYILEFYSPSFPLDEIVTKKTIDEINTKIKNWINIDLSSISDRIGSFIFQFPISNVHTNLKLEPDFCNATISIETNPICIYADDLTTTILTRFDNVVTGFATINGLVEDHKISLGDSNNFEWFSFSKKHQIVLNHYQVNFIRSIQINLNHDISEINTFTEKNGKKIKLLRTIHTHHKTGRDDFIDSRIRNRIYQNIEHNKQGNFMLVTKDQRLKTLQFLRKIINESHTNELWLIDPYLTAQDILDFFYNCIDFKVLLQCISSMKKGKEMSNENQTIENFKEIQTSCLKKESNLLDINLEWRAVHNCHGIPFHDRYLMLISKHQEAFSTIYSLGTSVNSLGNTHHIIQQVQDTKQLKTFLNDLWDTLNYKCCKIAKTEGGEII